MIFLVVSGKRKPEGGSDALATFSIAMERWAPEELGVVSQAPGAPSAEGDVAIAATGEGEAVVAYDAGAGVRVSGWVRERGNGKTRPKAMGKLGQGKAISVAASSAGFVAFALGREVEVGRAGAEEAGARKSLPSEVTAMELTWSADGLVVGLAGGGGTLVHFSGAERPSDAVSTGGTPPSVVAAGRSARDAFALLGSKRIWLTWPSISGAFQGQSIGLRSEPLGATWLGRAGLLVGTSDGLVRAFCGPKGAIQQRAVLRLQSGLEPSSVRWIPFVHSSRLVAGTACSFAACCSSDDGTIAILAARGLTAQAGAECNSRSPRLVLLKTLPGRPVRMPPSPSFACLSPAETPAARPGVVSCWGLTKSLEPFAASYSLRSPASSPGPSSWSAIAIGSHQAPLRSLVASTCSRFVISTDWRGSSKVWEVSGDGQFDPLPFGSADLLDDGSVRHAVWLRGPSHGQWLILCTAAGVSARHESTLSPSFSSTPKQQTRSNSNASASLPMPKGLSEGISSVHQMTEPTGTDGCILAGLLPHACSLVLWHLCWRSDEEGANMIEPTLLGVEALPDVDHDCELTAAAGVCESRKASTGVPSPIHLVVGTSRGEVCAVRVTHDGVNGSTTVAFETRAGPFGGPVRAVAVSPGGDKIAAIAACQGPESELRVLSLSTEGELVLEPAVRFHCGDSALAWLDSGIGADLLAVGDESERGVRVLGRARPLPSERVAAAWHTLATVPLGRTPEAVEWTPGGDLVSATGANIASFRGVNRSCLEAATERCGPFPDHHPSILFEWLTRGQVNRVRLVIRRLVSRLKSHQEVHQQEEAGWKVPLDDLLEVDKRQSAPRNQGRSAAAALLMEEMEQGGGQEDGPLGDEEAEQAAETVAKAACIHGLTGGDERVDLLAAVDAAKGQEQASAPGGRDFGVPDGHFLGSLRLSVLRHKRRPNSFGGNKQKTVAMPGRDILWALHAENQEALLVNSWPHVRTMGWTGFEALRKLGLPFWATSKEMLQRACADAAWEAFRETQDPTECAPFYACTGKIRLLAQLFRKAGEKRVAEFLTRDFSRHENKVAAAKNAYQLLSKHKPRLATAFFFLSGSPCDAVQVCHESWGDEQAAIALARLASPSTPDEKAHQDGEADGMSPLASLATSMLSNDAQATPAWKRHCLLWHLARHEEAVNELVAWQAEGVFDPSLCNLGAMLKHSLFVKNRPELLRAVCSLADVRLERSFLAYAEAGMPLAALERSALPPSPCDTDGRKGEERCGLSEEAVHAWVNEVRVRVGAACCARGGSVGRQAVRDVASLPGLDEDCKSAIRERLGRLQFCSDRIKAVEATEEGEHGAGTDEREARNRRHGPRQSTHHRMGASLPKAGDSTESLMAAEETSPLLVSESGEEEEASKRGLLKPSMSESALGKADEPAWPAERALSNERRRTNESAGDEGKEAAEGRPLSSSRSQSELKRPAREKGGTSRTGVRSPFNFVLLHDDLIRSCAVSSSDADELAIATLRRGVICTNLRRSLSSHRDATKDGRGRSNALSSFRSATAVAGDSFFEHSQEGSKASRESQAMQQYALGAPPNGDIGATALESHPWRPLFLAASASRPAVYILPYSEALPGRRCTLGDGGKATGQEVRFDPSGARFAAALSTGAVELLSVERALEGPAACFRAFDRRAESVAFLSGSVVACGGIPGPGGPSALVWDSLCHPRRAGVLSGTAFEVGCSSVAAIPGKASTTLVACGLGGEVAALDFRKLSSGSGRPGASALWQSGSAHGAPIMASCGLRPSVGVTAVATGCRDGDVRIWDAESGACLHTFPRLHGKHTFMYPYGKESVMQVGTSELVELSEGFLSCGGDGSVKLTRFSRPSPAPAFL